MSFPNSTYSDIVATTLEARSGTIADNVTKNNALLALMKQKGRQRTFAGGRSIVEELSFAENGNGGSYSGYDILPTAAQDVLSAAEFQIKQYAVPVVISGLEELQNAGKEQVIDLLEGRTGVAEATMANILCVGLYGDGTGNGGKNITGLDAAVPQDPTTGTYGGISRSTWTFWRSQLTSIGGAPASATIQGFMNTLWAQCTRGADKPDVISAGNNAWLAYLASLQPLQRFTDTNMANLGFDNIKFMSAPVVLDGGIGGAATSNDMYFLNTKYLSFRPHKDRNMKPLGKRVATNQDATVQILAWAGNLTCSGAQFQGRLKGS